MLSFLRNFIVFISTFLFVYGIPAHAKDESFYTVDHEQTRVLVFVYRSGFLKRFGHDHLISTKQIRGRLISSPPPNGQASFELILPVSSLIVDDPEQRKLAGGKFSKPVPIKAREATRHNMLSAKLLDAANHPEIRITGHLNIEKQAKSAITVTITLKDSQRDFVLPIDIERLGSGLLVQGRFQLLQSEMGIEPFSIMGGVIKVADGLDIQYRLAFKPEPIDKK